MSINERQATIIAVLTRVRECPPELAHELRVAAHRGRLSAEQASAAIAMLRRLPARQR